MATPRVADRNPAAVDGAVLFFLIPFGMTVLLSFQVTKLYQVAWSWDLTTWKDVFSHSYYWVIMARTLKMALICVVLCVFLGLPVAYALVNRLPSMENHVKNPDRLCLFGRCHFENLWLGAIFLIAPAS